MERQPMRITTRTTIEGSVAPLTFRGGLAIPPSGVSPPRLGFRREVHNQRFSIVEPGIEVLEIVTVDVEEGTEDTKKAGPNETPATWQVRWIPAHTERERSLARELAEKLKAGTSMSRAREFAENAKASASFTVPSDYEISVELPELTSEPTKNADSKPDHIVEAIPVEEPPLRVFFGILRELRNFGVSADAACRAAGDMVRELLEHNRV